MPKMINQAIVRLRKIPPERLLLLGGVLLLAGLGLWIYQVWPRPMRVIAFDVGKGNAFVIISPAGHAVIIDGGSSDMKDVGAKTLVPNLMLLGVKAIDAIILSHPDAEHVNGLPAIIESLPVRMILDPQLPGRESEYLQILALAEKKAIPLRRLATGDRLRLEPEVTLSVLAPFRASRSGAHADTNNSVVCLLQYRRARMLFSGDMEKEGEQALLAQGGDLHADVLQVAQYGGRYSATDAFLSAVHPTIGLLSCPAHNPWTPHPATLARLRAHQLKLYRTDVHGMITLSTDGGGWQVETFL
jgi:competence protein ComEC